MNKVLRNKQILIDEETGWKFGGDEVPGGNKGLGQRLSFEVKGERWVLLPGGESKSDDDRKTCNTLKSVIRKVPMDTCSTMHGWKHSTNVICWIDRLNIINSHRTNKVNSGKEGFG